MGAPAGQGVARATVSVTIDNQREVAAVNAWLQRLGPKIQLNDNQGCGCCVDIWDVQAPADALAVLPRAMYRTLSLQA